MGKQMGIRITADYSEAVLKAMRKQVEKALEECGLVAEGYAQVELTEKKAVDTGNLRNSITHKVIVDGKVRRCYIGTNVEYAPYIEFGTGAYAEKGDGRRTSWTYKDGKGKWHRTNGMAPRPYLRPAVAYHIKEYEQIIKDNLEN